MPSKKGEVTLFHPLEVTGARVKQGALN